MPQTPPLRWSKSRIGFIASISLVLAGIAGAITVSGNGCAQSNPKQQYGSIDLGDGSYYYQPPPPAATPAPGTTPPPDSITPIFRGALTADMKAVKGGEPVTFTYSLTNTSKIRQVIDHAEGDGFSINVIAQYLAWKSLPDPPKKPSKASRSTQKIVDAVDAQINNGHGGRMAGFGQALILPHIPPIKFAPGETKTFKTVWTPPKGSVQPGMSFRVLAQPIGHVNGIPASANAAIVLYSAASR